MLAGKYIRPESNPLKTPFVSTSNPQLGLRMGSASAYDLGI